MILISRDLKKRLTWSREWRHKAIKLEDMFKLVKAFQQTYPSERRTKKNGEIVQGSAEKEISTFQRKIPTRMQGKFMLQRMSQRIKIKK